MMVDFVTVALVSIPLGLALSISATVASFKDWDGRFKAGPFSEFKNEYRVPSMMMLACGLGFVPILGILYGIASWIMFFRRADLVK